MSKGDFEDIKAVSLANEVCVVPYPLFLRRGRETEGKDKNVFDPVEISRMGELREIWNRFRNPSLHP